MLSSEGNIVCSASYILCSYVDISTTSPGLICPHQNIAQSCHHQETRIKPARITLILSGLLLRLAGIKYACQDYTLAWQDNCGKPARHLWSKYITCQVNKYLTG